MSFGVYLHIPYCLQRCTYCDFATYERSKILPSQDYVHLVLKELRLRKDFFGARPLDTLYFGGGTPSLLPSSEIISLIEGLEKNGFHLSRDAEVTIEINPATIDEEKLTDYLSAGINRFSVGAQTFDDRLLKMVHREHNARQTLETLELLQRKTLNFSFDILFALPSQTIAGVEKDVDIALTCGASHISPYCLTVPSGHPLSTGRAPDEEQADMFELIRSKLLEKNFHQYEISNFSKPGLESKHNLLYWTDQEYWGLGLSAHSYSKMQPWGVRFWNKSNIHDYVREMSALEAPQVSPIHGLESEQFETLELHQSVTDYCHTALRLMRGLDLDAFQKKFPSDVTQLVLPRLSLLQSKGLLESQDQSWHLSEKGIVLSNLVFQAMTFLRNELNSSEKSPV